MQPGNRGNSLYGNRLNYTPPRPMWGQGNNSGFGQGYGYQAQGYQAPVAPQISPMTMGPSGPGHYQPTLFPQQSPQQPLNLGFYTNREDRGFGATDPNNPMYNPNSPYANGGSPQAMGGYTQGSIPFFGQPAQGQPVPATNNYGQPAPSNVPGVNLPSYGPGQVRSQGDFGPAAPQPPINKPTNPLTRGNVSMPASGPMTYFDLVRKAQGLL